MKADIFAIENGGQAFAGHSIVTLITREYTFPSLVCEGDPGCCGKTWYDPVPVIYREPRDGVKLDLLRFGYNVSPSRFAMLEPEARAAFELDESVPVCPGNGYGFLHVSWDGKTSRWKEVFPEERYDGIHYMSNQEYIVQYNSY